MIRPTAKAGLFAGRTHVSAGSPWFRTPFATSPTNWATVARAGTKRSSTRYSASTAPFTSTRRNARQPGPVSPLHLAPQDREDTWAWSQFAPPVLTAHEGNANNRWHLLLMAASITLALWRA